MILDAFLLKSCSKAAPAALGGCGGLGQLWEALAELTNALSGEGLTSSAGQAHTLVCLNLSEEPTNKNSHHEGRLTSASI